MKNIAIIMGGYSSEFEISLKSGGVVYQFLDKTKYNGFRVHIFKDKWVYVDASQNEYPIDRNDFSVTVNGNGESGPLKQTKPVQLPRAFRATKT